MANYFPSWFNIQFTRDDGSAVAGGFVRSYVAGTSTETPTYKSNGDANSNPIHLDSSGRCELLMRAGVSYKFRWFEADGITFVSEADNVSISGLITAMLHNTLPDLQLAGSGITYGHISDDTQSIHGEKDFDSGLVRVSIPKGYAPSQIFTQNEDGSAFVRSAATLSPTNKQSAVLEVGSYNRIGVNIQSTDIDPATIELFDSSSNVMKFTPLDITFNSKSVINPIPILINTATLQLPNGYTDYELLYEDSVLTFLAPTATGSKRKICILNSSETASHNIDLGNSHVAGINPLRAAYFVDASAGRWYEISVY